MAWIYGIELAQKLNNLSLKNNFRLTGLGLGEWVRTEFQQNIIEKIFCLTGLGLGEWVRTEFQQSITE